MNGAVPDEPWTLARGERGDEQFLVRFRTRAPEEVERVEQPLLIIASWAFEGVSSFAPDSDTLDRMETLETALFDSTDAERWAVPVVVLTDNFVRQWRFYAREIEAVQEGLNSALAGHSVYPIEFATFEDPEWNAYFEVADNAKAYGLPISLTLPANSSKSFASLKSR